MHGRFFLFVVRVWLLAVLLNVAVVRLLGDLPSIVYAVLFPVLALLVLALTDWLDRRVTFVFKWTP